MIVYILGLVFSLLGIIASGIGENWTAMLWAASSLGWVIAAMMGRE